MRRFKTHLLMDVKLSEDLGSVEEMRVLEDPG